MGVTTVTTAIAIGGLFLPGPEDLLLVWAAARGLRVLKGTVESASGKIREIAIVLDASGKKLLTRGELMK